jgi:CheY-like chemotaxis protein
MASPLIYIVDDDPAFAKIMGKTLENAGFYNLKYFTDCHECLIKLSEKPKFVFLDFSLESLNGLDVLIRIKETNKSTKVLMVTHLVDEEVEKKCLDNGASLYINKSEILNGLPQRLLKILKGSWFFGI